MSLLSTRNSKGACPHSQSLACLTNAQSAQLKSPLLDTEASLLNLTECFSSLDPKMCSGHRLLDNFPDRIFFYPCDHLKESFCKLHLEALDCFCQLVFTDLSILVVITGTSIVLSRNM